MVLLHNAVKGHAACVIVVLELTLDLPGLLIARQLKSKGRFSCTGLYPTSAANSGRKLHLLPRLRIRGIIIVTRKLGQAKEASGDEDHQPWVLLSYCVYLLVFGRGGSAVNPAAAEIDERPGL
jgi:hypothetical protein